MTERASPPPFPPLSTQPVPSSPQGMIEVFWQLRDISPDGSGQWVTASKEACEWLHRADPGVYEIRAVVPLSLLTAKQAEVDARDREIELANELYHKMCEVSNGLRSECEALKAELAAHKEDAERWQRARRIIRIRSQPMLSGYAECFEFRLGYSRVDCVKDPGAAWLDPARFEEECATIDAAIDAAREK